MFVSDYVLNGIGHGQVGEGLARFNFDPGFARPWVGYDRNGRAIRCVTINTGRKVTDNATGRKVWEKKNVPISALLQQGYFHPIWNATTMRKGDWIELDKIVLKAARPRLSAWADLAASSQVSGFNAMGRLTYEYEAMSDPGEAVVDMDGLADARQDNPLFKLRSLPLPITHSDFMYSARRIAVSENQGEGLNTTTAEAAGRRVAEMIERTTIGTETGMSFGTQAAGFYGSHDGTSTVYGYTNYPYRITKTDLTTPTGANPDAIMTDVLEMIETMTSNNFFGPYILYVSTGYTRYLNDDYFRAGSTSAVRSVKQRIMEMEGIQDIRRLDLLTGGFQMILVQMDSETGQAINGMDLTTVMWESQGGMRINWKVMAIQVPLLRARYNGIAAILHGTTS